MVPGQDARLFDIPATQPFRRHEPEPRSLGTDHPEEGAWFEYAACPDVFLGRRGRGPLRIAWDTNVLIDYAIHGQAMWDDEQPFAPDGGRKHVEELHALHAVMQLWLIRDVRLHVFRAQVDDAKRRLSDERRRERERQIDEIASALYCLGHETVDPTDEDAAVTSGFLDWMTPSTDRDLVEAAITAGCHVFLTRDEDDILRHAGTLGSYWLAALSPSQLIDRLAAAGELGFASYGSMVMPDSHKWLHVLAACSPSTAS